MNRLILKSLLPGVAALPLIALGAYLLSPYNGQQVHERRITLDLDRPDGMKEYIQEWMPASAVESDKLLGSIEDESVTMIVRRNAVACSFEPALITVDMDLAKGGKVQRIFISSRGMALNEAVSSMKQILAMMDAKPEKLNEWTKGTLAWSKAPKLWPSDTPSPMDAWHSQIVRTTDIECELEVRRSDDGKKPWRIVIRTGPRLFPVAHSPGEQEN